MLQCRQGTSDIRQIQQIAAERVCARGWGAPLLAPHGRRSKPLPQPQGARWIVLVLESLSYQGPICLPGFLRPSDTIAVICNRSKSPLRDADGRFEILLGGNVFAAP
jgi:hypothetical protein